MKVYPDRQAAEDSEGTIEGLDPYAYGDVTNADFDYPNGHVFGFLEGGRVRVAWSTACMSCGAPAEEDELCEMCSDAAEKATS